MPRGVVIRLSPAVTKQRRLINRCFQKEVRRTVSVKPRLRRQSLHSRDGFDCLSFDHTFLVGRQDPRRDGASPALSFASP